MIVVDSSVVVSSLADNGPVGTACASRLSTEPRLVAPAILDAEVVHALRGLVSGKKIAATVAGAAIQALPRLGIERLPVQLLVSRMWELKDNATAYDAAYVAMAEQLNARLVTGDRKFLGIPGRRCVVDIVG